MRIDKEFVKGVAYYLGDGRLAAPRSLSTGNQNIKTISFFIKWLKKYFNIQLQNMKIKIITSNPNYNKKYLRIKFSKKLNINKNYITSIAFKEKSKPHHKDIIEVWANNASAKRNFDNVISTVKEKCLKNNNLAIEYIKGIMAAEASPKYSIKSGSREIRLKMKNEEEIKYIGKLLNNIGIKSSILKVKTEDGMWVVAISGFYELNKLNELDIFEIESNKRNRLKDIISSYKRIQVKKGDVERFYLEKLKLLNNKFKKRFTALELSKLIRKDRKRIVFVLRILQKKNLINGKRRKIRGRPFEFWVNQ